MSTILKFLRDNLAGDPVAIMTKQRVEEVIAEIEQIKAERDAYKDNADLMNTATARYFRRAQQAEKERDTANELLKDTRPFCYGCAYVKDGRLADRYATKKGNE